jgi:hypothetical protein
MLTIFCSLVICIPYLGNVYSNPWIQTQFSKIGLFVFYCWVLKFLYIVWILDHYQIHDLQLLLLFWGCSITSSFIFSIVGLELRAYTLSHSTSPFLWRIFFKIGSQELLCQGWVRTLILLISVSWVARITGLSHQCPALLSILNSVL